MNDNANSPPPLDRLADALAPHGLFLRGGFHPDATDVAAGNAGTVILIGNAGPDIWRAFAASSSPEELATLHALDRWTRKTVNPIAEDFECEAVYPFVGPPYSPFQNWAKRCDDVHSSPLGILIHPRYGLWHAYRAALIFSDKLGLPTASRTESPCETCIDKPCLNGCPVGAFTSDGYDVEACATHIRASEGAPCMSGGCLARRACPVGTEYAYVPEQAQFHMTAFERARPSL